jgi:hypothetical protein
LVIYKAKLHCYCASFEKKIEGETKKSKLMPHSEGSSIDDDIEVIVASTDTEHKPDDIVIVDPAPVTTTPAPQQQPNPSQCSFLKRWSSFSFEYLSLTFIILIKVRVVPCTW